VAHKSHIVSRRVALLGVAASAICEPAVAGPNQGCPTSGNGDGPVFSPSGPDAERWGLAEAFPIADPSLHGRPGEPHAKYRVGAYSHFDDLYQTRRVTRAAAPWCFSYSRSDISYSYKGARYSVDDYLSRNPVTGLLIAKDDTILLERYQYGRTDKDRQFSGSMVKSIVGLLIGIAVSEGAIRSIGDTTETYVPGFRGTEYGKTPIRDLLHMSSGVKFGEEDDNERDLDRLWIDMVLGLGSSNQGTINSITQFNDRLVTPGTRFRYASIEPDVLSIVLRYATGKSLAEYLHEKVWAAIGTEADAVWLLDAEGFEVAHTFFGAVLRDYARLGRLLAHDGAWEGKQIVPARWMMEATTTRESDAYLLPGRGNPRALGYGYLMWLLPGNRRQFALISGRGQFIVVDPPSKLVMVQTAVETKDEVWSLWAALVRKFGE
jgi:CubicO group peptidase (beta-lactamase class C family)